MGKMTAAKCPECGRTWNRVAHDVYAAHLLSHDERAMESEARIRARGSVVEGNQHAGPFETTLGGSLERLASDVAASGEAIPPAMSAREPWDGTPLPPEALPDDALTAAAVTTNPPREDWPDWEPTAPMPPVGAVVETPDGPARRGRGRPKGSKR